MISSSLIKYTPANYISVANHLDITTSMILAKRAFLSPFPPLATIHLRNYDIAMHDSSQMIST